MNFDTVVIPAAGSGTRMLPATHATAKELLPVYDTPLLQFALDEACNAGVKRIVIVTHPKKTGIASYFECTKSMSKTLRAPGKTNLVEELKKVGSPDGVEVSFVQQEEPLGLGHAVLCARDQIEGDVFGVILPDDLIFGGATLNEMRMAFQSAEMNSLVAATLVPREDTCAYGIFKTAGAIHAGQCALTDGLIEKPSPQEAPSTLAAVGRYVLKRDILDELERTSPGAGDEIQLTDAISSLGKLAAYRISSERFDCGDHEGIFRASCTWRELKTSSIQNGAQGAPALVAE